MKLGWRSWTLFKCKELIIMQNIWACLRFWGALWKRFWLTLKREYGRYKDIKKKLLFKLGKEVVIKTVEIAIPAYMMNIFKILGGQLKEIYFLLAKF